MKDKFNANGVDYKVVNGQLFQVDRTCLLPVYNPDRHLVFVAKRYGFIDTKIVPSIHNHGHQLGQRAKTLEQARSEHIPALEHAQVIAAKKRPADLWWKFVYWPAVILILGVAAALIYELFFV